MSTQALNFATFDYAMLTRVLDHVNGSIRAPEVHGMICGFICAGNYMSGRAWLDIIIGSIAPEVEQKDNLRGYLIAIYMRCNRNLKEATLDVTALLPGEEEGLDMRAKALSEWCDGLMTALSLAGIHVDELGSTDVQETLFQLWEIAQMDYDRIEFRDDDESAYNQVIEYVTSLVYALHEAFTLGDMTPMPTHRLYSEQVH